MLPIFRVGLPILINHQDNPWLTRPLPTLSREFLNGNGNLGYSCLWLKLINWGLPFHFTNKNIPLCLHSMICRPLTTGVVPAGQKWLLTCVRSVSSLGIWGSTKGNKDNHYRLLKLRMEIRQKVSMLMCFIHIFLSDRGRLCASRELHKALC